MQWGPLDDAIESQPLTPVRAKYDVLRDKHALLTDGSLVLALSGLVPPRFASDVGASLAEMDAQRDIEPAMQTLRARYILLR